MKKSRALWLLASFLLAALFVWIWQLVADYKLVNPVSFPARTAPGRPWCAASPRATSASNSLRQSSACSGAG